MPIEKTYLDQFRVRNKTNHPITLGDLVNVTIPAKKTIDLLTQPRVTKGKINQSQDLQQGVRMGFLEIVKSSPYGRTADERKAIIADESNTRIVVSTTPPENPLLNDLWVDIS